MTSELDLRLRRLTLKSRRRGLLELDLVLGRFAERQLQRLSPDLLDLYEKLLGEEDQCILGWLTEAGPCPAEYADLVAWIVAEYQIIDA